MRIGLVSLHTSPLDSPGQGDAGGMNVVVREAALALERLGHEVAIATRASLQTPPGVSPLAVTSRVQVHAIEAGPLTLSKHALPEYLNEFSAKLARIPAFRDAQVLHAHYWLSGIAALNVGSALGIPVFATLHTVGAQKNAHLASGDTPEPAIRLSAERRLTRETLIIAGSQSELTAAQASYGLVREGSLVVHPGVDTKLFTPSRRNVLAETCARALSLTVLGRVQPLKGQDLALEAFARFVEQWPELARASTLTIAGEPTPGHEPFYEQLKTRSRGLAVTFLPAQSRVATAKLLRESDLVLVPSHSETFGLVALEAAASGTPVVAARTTGLIESVQEGVSGMLVDGRDALAWAAAIAESLTDRAALARIGRTAREYSLQHNWAAHARTLEQAYRGSLIDNRS